MKCDIGERIVLDHDELVRRVEACREAGKSIVWSNGVFDLWHVGHTRYLEEAAAEGDVLVVGVNSDASVRRYKGPDRPVHPLAERLEIVAGQHVVDFATSFEEDTCDRILELLRPDVHVKGPEYTLDNLPEGNTLRRLGIRFVAVCGDKQHSTSGLIEQIKRSGAAP